MEFPVGRRIARTVAVLVASGLPGLSQTAPVTPLSEVRILAINQQIADRHDVAVSGHGEAGADTGDVILTGLLQQRAAILADLMETNPRAAVESALPDDLRRDLASHVPDPGELLEVRGEWTGPLETTVADDFQHHRSKTLRTIRVGQRDVKLFWDSPQASVCSPSVTVRGIRLGDRIAADSGDTSPGNSCPTTGDLKTAVLLLSYPSTPVTEGYTQSYVKSVFFGPAPSVSDYWRQGSYGSVIPSGDVFGPFTLDADYTCSQTGAILQSAIAAADSMVDFTAYQRIALILPVTLSPYCGWLGLAQVGCTTQVSPGKGNFTASVSWIVAVSLGPNIFGDLGGLLATAVHEGGHNFGLQHSSSLDYDTVPAGPPGTDGVPSEYGNNFTFMGTDPGDFDAPHKNMLGWLNRGTGWLQVQSGGTWTLAPLSDQSGSLHALRVQRGTGASSAPNGQWLWIEYRQPVGPYEPTVLINGEPRNFNGALINLEDPNQSWGGHTELLDFQPVRLPNDFNLAPMLAGVTWADPYSNLSLTTGIATPSGMAITVSYDNGCAAISPGSQSYAPGAATGQINVSAAPGCSWNAAATAEWIAFTGAASGTGPGTVTYSVAANATTAARSAIVSISHQTLNITRPRSRRAVPSPFRRRLARERARLSLSCSTIRYRRRTLRTAKSSSTHGRSRAVPAISTGTP
jgi:hypothetical protein